MPDSGFSVHPRSFAFIGGYYSMAYPPAATVCSGENAPMSDSRVAR